MLSRVKNIYRNIVRRVVEKTPISKEKKMGVSLLYDAHDDTDKKPNKYCSVSIVCEDYLKKKLFNRAK